MVTLKQKLKKCSEKNKWQNIIIFILLLLFVGLIVYICVQQVQEHYAQSDPMLDKLRNHLKPLHPVVEKLALFKGNKSYTINKKKVYLCLKENNDKYYDFNMLVYVFIHEIAHVLCNEIGHTPKYYEIFRGLLKKASNMKLYDPRKPIIQNYCGHK
tara:strand:- start:1530 stop:1997 length:468 start_codon:yes stop_codon:yes gene_type:complete